MRGPAGKVYEEQGEPDPGPAAGSGVPVPKLATSVFGRVLGSRVKEKP
jgi:hypothetical protein